VLNGAFRLTYQMPIASGQPAMLLVVDLPMDGTEVPAHLSMPATKGTMG
jgi:hypothetical protein